MINCVYIHIPFCQKKCKYCSFCSFELLKYKNNYIEALIKEIKHFYKQQKLKTLYFGGGTPSLLDISDLKQILDEFNFNSDTETTIEVNPNRVNLKKLKELKHLGFNRFSLGVQSFDDNILKIIGRCHTKKEILNCLENFNKADIDNYSIDLIYGLPQQDINKWVETLNFALKFDIKHISLYGLSIEKGTYFYKFPPEKLPDLDTQAKMYEAGLNILKKDFIHYEFSNFARAKKYRSKHNLAYWNRKNYYGFGLSACGFIENKRYANTHNLKEYLSNPTIRCYKTLNLNEQIEEEIFLNLRTKDGLNLDKINKKYNTDIYEKYKIQFEKFIKNKYLVRKNNIIRFTQKGILISNEVLCEFIEV